MIDHISIQCTDLVASAAFYDVVLEPLGARRVMDFGDSIGYGVAPHPDFWIGAHSTGEGFRESHVAFAAPSRAAVRAFFDVAVAEGALALHAPRSHDPPKPVPRSEHALPGNTRNVVVMFEPNVSK